MLYALSNQMLAEGRIAEMDAVAMQQNINMVFDEQGYDTAQNINGRKMEGPGGLQQIFKKLLAQITMLNQRQENQQRWIFLKCRKLLN